MIVSGASPSDPSLTMREQLSRELTRSEGQLGARFQTRTEEARAAWPRVQIDLAQFASHVARTLDPSEQDLPRALDELCVSDLYLACGCVMSAPAALAAFDERYLRDLRTFVKDVDSSPARLDELKQLLRERLLLGSATTLPRISTYSGRGALVSWVQVAAQRLALSSLRSKRPPTVPGDEAIEQLMPSADPELDFLRVRYAEEFRDALQAALKGLLPRERLVLRLHLVDGLSLTKIASAYKVSQSTVSRWLMQSRETIRDYTKQHLRGLLGLSSAEFESIARLVHSRLELSLSTVLASQRD